jgi:SAM-dependent methyltransferase
MSQQLVESAVHERYAAAAQRVEPALCCPVEYAGDYLAVVPPEIIERDYGCGDPTRFVRAGDVVVDLGSGAGKLCYILSQIVGPKGRVIGVDCNQEMLSLARRHHATVAERIGFANVKFHFGLIQDLKLDLDRLGDELNHRPIRDARDWLELRAAEDRLRLERPMIADDSVDCVVSSCVLNLVRPQDRVQLFGEIYRVLRRGGRAAISDIVADEDVPERLRQDPTLWTGCISGAFREDLFLQAFADAGFHGIEIAARQSAPWRTVEGIEFRSMTVVAYKGKEGPCLERNQAVIYRGPFKKVEDDDGHVFVRGERVAVCDKTFRLLQREPYDGQFEPVQPREEVPLEAARPFDCRRSAHRHPRETKGKDYKATTEASGECCGGDQPCC